MTTEQAKQLQTHAVVLFQFWFKGELLAHSDDAARSLNDFFETTKEIWDADMASALHDAFIKRA